MRLRSILILASLITATLVLPGAAAEPRYECAEEDLVDGHARLSLRRDCTLEAALLEDIVCVGGWGGRVEQDVAGHTVSANYCDGGLVDRVRDRIAVQAAQPCQEGEAGFWGGGVVTHSDCSVDVYVIDSYRVCPAGTEDGRVTHDAGAASATVGYCLPPVAVAGPCKESVRTAPATTIYTHSDCSTQVDVKAYDCVWNCGWQTLVDTPLLTVRVYRDNGYSPSALPACNGFWYHEETVGPVTVWTDGSARCTGADVDLLETHGKDVYVPELMACLWKGSYKPFVETPVATVWVYTCDDPDA